MFRPHDVPKQRAHEVPAFLGMNPARLVEKVFAKQLFNDLVAYTCYEVEVINGR